MSKGIRRTLQPSLLASKRFIVSACAAIAMVMGAMSVGASMFDHSEPSDHHQQQAKASAIFGADTSKTRDPQDTEPTSSLKTQHTLPEKALLPENKATASSPVPVLPGVLTVLKEIIQTPHIASKLPLKVDTPVVADIVPENIIPKTPITEDPVPPPELTPTPTLPDEPVTPPVEDQPSSLGIQSAPENPTE